MKTIETIHELRTELKSHRQGTIGFVPTMGYLHQGHLSLVERAKQECDTVVMSIFVNPLQFGPGEDLDRYPRDLKRDQALAEAAGVDFLFHPSVSEMYPTEPLTQVHVEKVTERLCGASRPGHFAGVATVVTKLFHIVAPDRAYFGMKDAQQVAVIEQMVHDLHFPVTIVPCPTVREPDGLALSSRNVYLSPEEREQALVINRTLREVEQKWAQEQFTSADELAQFVRDRIQTAPLADIDYAEVLTYPRLEKPGAAWKEQRLIVAVAVRFGKTRLIDNVLLDGRGEKSCSEQ
ncbi:pantoate--beta-alanine ligase [Thermoactinomyces vulgaris]|jgi:pantoate--beta-alanine ligase|nr:pantoate--beta-alanine ligase [Thermoactinomyces vulgaris]